MKTVDAFFCKEALYFLKDLHNRQIRATENFSKAPLAPPKLNHERTSWTDFPHNKTMASTSRNSYLWLLWRRILFALSLCAFVVRGADDDSTFNAEVKTLKASLRTKHSVQKQQMDFKA